MSKNGPENEVEIRLWKAGDPELSMPLGFGHRMLLVGGVVLVCGMGLSILAVNPLLAVVGLALFYPGKPSGFWGMWPGRWF